MRKLFTIAIYTLTVLLIGRSLPFLPRISFVTNSFANTEKVKKEIESLIQKQKGEYSVYFKDLKTHEAFGIREKTVLTAASLNKIPIVAVLYHLASQNKINLEEKVTLQKEDIQDYGTGKLRYEKPGRTYSLKTLTKLALVSSDNTAAHILANKIGEDVIQKTIENWDLTQTSMKSNKTSVYDMHILFDRLYKGAIASEALTQELLGFLTNSDTEDRLPLLLPKESVVYHKTGDAIGNLHDVGIIESNGTAFYVGVMTSDIGEAEKEAKITIARIANELFFFETNRK